MKQIGKYTLKQEIATCTDGIVYEASMQESKFAIKAYKIESVSTVELKEIVKEINLLNLMEHKNIVKVVGRLKSKNHYYVVYEYYNKGTLQDYLNNKGEMMENQVRKIVRELIEALNKLYKIISPHSNLELSKIFLHSPSNDDSDFDIKLGGFKKVKKKSQYTKADDIQSIGVIVQKLLFGVKVNKKKIHSCNKISLEVIDFIMSTTQPDVEKRITWEELIVHPFVINVNLIKQPLVVLNENKQYKLPATKCKEHTQRPNKDHSLNEKIIEVESDDTHTECKEIIEQGRKEIIEQAKHLTKERSSNEEIAKSSNNPFEDCDDESCITGVASYIASSNRIIQEIISSPIEQIVLLSSSEREEEIENDCKKLGVKLVKAGTIKEQIKIIDLYFI